MCKKIYKMNYELYDLYLTIKQNVKENIQIGQNRVKIATKNVENNTFLLNPPR